MLLYLKSLGCGWGRLWSLTQLCWDGSNGRSPVVKKPHSTSLGADLLAQHLCFDKALWQDKMYRNTAACLLGKTPNIVASPVATLTDRGRHVFRAADFKTFTTSSPCDGRRLSKLLQWSLRRRQQRRSTGQSRPESAFCWRKRRLCLCNNHGLHMQELCQTGSSAHASLWFTKQLMDPQLLLFYSTPFFVFRVENRTRKSNYYCSFYGYRK